MKFLSFALLLGICGIAFADSHGTNQEASAENAAATEQPEEKQYVTVHSMRIGGKTISYTATADSMLMNNDDREFRDVAFYRDDVEAHATRRYHPGE